MRHPSKPTDRRRLTWLWLIACTLCLVFAQLSCNYLLGGRADPVGATLEALQAQQTDLSQTLEAFTAVARQGDTTQIAQTTLDASLATATAQAQLVSTLSSQPLPSETPTPAADPDERMLKSAKILLFEDMSASRYIRIVKEALDSEGYFYQDVGSAKGWFKTTLLDDEEWDLVIAAAEAEREFGGEFFEYIDDRVASGSAAIVENWDIDLAPDGKAGQLLSRCGVRYQGDWFEPRLRVFYWLYPDHPIFNQPNDIPPALRNSARVWTGDLGDLLQVDPNRAGNGGNPTILAGTNPNIKTSNGVLVSCLNGRLILQTFRTHEYHHDDMLNLWKNYIFNTLKSYYAQSGKVIPTPVATAQATSEGTSTPAGPTPGPEYIFEHGCDGIFSVRLVDAPNYQKDLFEHHADGLFLVLRVQIQNQADFPIMVWDGDYFVEGRSGERDLVYQPDRDATGYLYIDGLGELIQDTIEPGELRQVGLAFDIDPKGGDWDFVFRPGSEFDGAVCEARIALQR